MAQTEAQRKASLNYRKAKVKQLNVALYPDDADLVEWLDGKENKQAYVRELIREDMRKNGFEGGSMASFAMFEYCTQDGTELEFHTLKNQRSVDDLTNWILNHCTDEADLYFIRDGSGDIVRLIEWGDDHKVIASDERLTEELRYVEDYFSFRNAKE